MRVAVQMDTDEEEVAAEEEASEEEEEKQGTSEDENEGTSERSAASEEEEEKQEASEDENEGTSKRRAASEDEQEKSSRQETHGRKRKLLVSDAQECKDDHTLSWVPTALANINSVEVHMLRRDGFIAHPSPKTCLPDLKRVRDAAMALVNNTDAAISFAKSQQSFIDRKALEGKLLALQQELAQSKEQSQAERCKQDQQAKAELLKQSNLFQREKESLTCSHKLEREALIDRYTQQSKAELLKQSNLFQKEKESLTCAHKLGREALIDQYTHEQRDLKRQLEEEKDKSICCVCHDKPRDTIILPCLHFQYCFSCLLRHRETNSNTCPTCRGPIQGLSMSSYLATQ